MSPTENAQLTEPDTVALTRYDGPEVLDDGTGPLTLAPRIEESQRLREHFRALVDDPENLDDLDDLEGERVWQARRVVTLMVALALLAVTVGITLIGLGGTDQRRPEPATDVAAAAAAAKADAGRSQGTALPETPTAVAATPSAPPVATPSATGSPSAGSPSVSPSATPSATSSPSASLRPSPSASSVKPTPKAPAPSPKPSVSKPAAATPACAVAVTTSPGLLSYYGNVSLTNRGEALAGWTASFSLPAGYRVQDVSGRSWSQSGGRVTVTGAESVPKGASTAFTFRVSLLLGPRDPGSGWQLNGVGCS